MAKLDANKADLAKLADPRTIKMNDAVADKIAATRGAGLLHHRHDPLDRGRRADGADGDGLSSRGGREPVHPNIREHMITLITPIVEVDGRDRVVDLYNWHDEAPGRSRCRASCTGATTWRTTTTATRWA